MNAPDHLVQWDDIFLRISGRKLQEAVGRLVLEKRLPITDVEVDFGEGYVAVAARIKKGVSIPIRCTIREVLAEGGTLRAVLEDFSTFGSIPLPKNLFRLIDDLRLPDGIAFDPAAMTVKVKIDALLPPYLALTVKAIQFIPGGVAVHLGEGSADIPA
ncbi:MAG TPA: hypothetical protein VFR18_02020 [Terriglobia bacterium]|nr:hypothetical protein [Terriglobia bacterium]